MLGILAIKLASFSNKNSTKHINHGTDEFPEQILMPREIKLGVI